MNQVISEQKISQDILVRLKSKKRLTFEQDKYLLGLVGNRNTQLKAQIAEQEKRKQEIERTIKEGLANLRKSNIMERDAGRKNVTRLPWGGVEKIHKVTRISRGTISSYLRGYPISDFYADLIQATMVELGYDNL